MDLRVPTRELDHPAAYACVARFGKSSLALPPTALVKRTCQPGIARERPTISYVARQHLLDEHVCGLNTGQESRNLTLSAPD